MQETAADAGTRRGLQRQAADAGGWKVWETSRYMAIRAGRGGGEQVLHRGVTTKNSCLCVCVGGGIRGGGNLEISING